MRCHELGILDLVERAGPAGDVDAGLQFAVALARGRRFQRPVSLFRPSTRNCLAADEAPASQVRRDRLGGNGAVEGEGGEAIDQGVELQRHPLRQPPRGTLPPDRRPRGIGVVEAGPSPRYLPRSRRWAPRARCLPASARARARLPAPWAMTRQDHAAQGCQRDRQGVHAVAAAVRPLSASRIALGMSTG
jgi:hypothetical protein